MSGSVVPDQTHPLHALDAPLRRLVGVPALEPGPFHLLDVDLSAQGDHDVSSPHASSVRALSLSPLMSAPTSASDSADSRLIQVPGLVPAEWTSMASPARLVIGPAAIYDLPPFFTQMGLVKFVGPIVVANSGPVGLGNSPASCCGS